MYDTKGTSVCCSDAKQPPQIQCAKKTQFRLYLAPWFQGSETAFKYSQEVSGRFMNCSGKPFLPLFYHKVYSSPSVMAWVVELLTPKCIFLITWPLSFHINTWVITFSHFTSLSLLPFLLYASLAVPLNSSKHLKDELLLLGF